MSKKTWGDEGTRLDNTEVEFDHVTEEEPTTSFPASVIAIVIGVVALILAIISLL